MNQRRFKFFFSLSLFTLILILFLPSLLPAQTSPEGVAETHFRLTLAAAGWDVIHM